MLVSELVKKLLSIPQDLELELVDSYNIYKVDAIEVTQDEEGKRSALLWIRKTIL